MTAEPFVDYREKITTVSRSQQASIMGRSNLAMVESGLVDWSDVVSSTRIRSLREVVSRKKLTVNQMVASGVTRGRAEEAFNAVNTGTHTAKEARRQQLVKKLLGKGFSRQQILDAAGRSIGSRISIGEGPSGASSIPMVPLLTPGPRLKAAITRAAAMKPKGTAGAALTQIKSDKSGRLKLTADGMRNFLGGIVNSLKSRFGLDVASADMSARKPAGLTIETGQVAEFTKDSEFKDVLYHRTSPAGKKRLIEDGISLDKNAVGIYGAGFYTSTSADEAYGSALIKVAIDARKVLSVTQREIMDRYAEFFRANPGADGGLRFSESLLAEGYDAIEIDKGKRNWVVGLKPASIRIVTGR